MAHKTLINGTSYEISGGRTLVNGTGYSIDKGKTLVGGTAYEVGFGKPVTIIGGYNIIGAGYTATIDDVSYPFTSAWSLETVSTASVTVTSLQATGRITVNGEVVFTGVGDYTVDLSDATHILLYSNALVMMITTYNIESPKDVTITVTGVGYSGLAQIEHNGIVYTGATKFTAKTGDLIRVKAKTTTGNTDYYYLVTSDALVNMNYQTSGSGGATGSVGITTIPEGHALVTINKASYYLGDTYVSIDGVQYQKYATRVVPIGTVIYCHTKAGNKEDIGSVSITLNGQEVSTVTEVGMGVVRGEYYYTVTRMAKIEMTYEEHDQTSVITITEQ